MVKRSSKKPSRPTRYSDELASQICNLLASGGSLRAAAREVGIDESTVRGWVVGDIAGFGAKFARARLASLLSLHDEILELCDEEPPQLKHGGVDHGWVGRQRMRVDTRRWLLSKVLPHTYGAVSSLDGGVTVVVETGVPQQHDDS